ncbi:hypothetical protein ANCCEY_07552 [Ancylostoma ceylanicum]|uniref:C2 domain-containing protein n=1 Tax=Ancylostoma ceylanicum TaxID=53326 RepID=A0A0D6LMP4_9BILA|nr:hypothetical protein ANCCEY_07552 [Ancylostoma ceylanicum]
MARTESACRLKLLRADVPADQLPAGCSVTDLLPAVNVKEKIEVNGESRLVQKKKTIYPEWEKCWDTAVTEGRILQIVLMFNQTPVVEATMRLELLVLTINTRVVFNAHFSGAKIVGSQVGNSDSREFQAWSCGNTAVVQPQGTSPKPDIVSKCKNDSITHIWINTKPVGRILAQTRHLKQAVVLDA